MTVVRECLPAIDIAVHGPTRNFIEKMCVLAEAAGVLAVDRHYDAMGQAGWDVANIRPREAGSVGGQLIGHPDTAGRVAVEMRGWEDDWPTRAEYCEAARRVFGPLLRSYNRAHGTRHRLRVERAGADMPRLSGRTKQYFERFVGAANKSSLHPFDWRRFYDFVSVSRKALREEEMRMLLVDAGFNRDRAGAIAQIYSHLMDYKRHRVWPWLVPSA